jgi:hypothetical protein
MNSNSRGLYLPPAVLNLPALSWPARLLLAEVLDLYKVNGQVWANDQHFVNRLPGTSLRTVQSAIKELVDAGALIRVTNQKAQHKRLLTPTDLPQNLHEAPADFAGATPNLPQNLREPTAKSAGDLPQNLHEAPADFAVINYTLNTIGNISQEDAQISSASAESEQDSSQNQNAPANSKTSAGKADKPGSVLGAGLNVPFDEFWQAYGKKKGRHKSELKWKALTPAERTAALAALPAYVAKTPEVQYRKDPLSWLNGKHWEDELPAESAPAARPAPTQPAPVGAAPVLTPDLNHEVVAERQARRDAEAAEARRRVRAASQAS